MSGLSVKRKPVCVAWGDTHWTLATLELATSVTRQGLALAQELNVPVLLNGDTLDAKAIIRAEVANRLLQLLTDAPVPVIVNVGNHDLINSKSKEHSLNFLKPIVDVVDAPRFVQSINAWVIPYMDDGDELAALLGTLPKGSTLFLHQGIIGAKMGAYIKDKSSLPKETFADFRTYFSHYHQAQQIKCGRPRRGAIGLASYLGSPYSVTAAEAEDGPKGINVIYDDGTFELVPTNLRKHVKAKRTVETVLDPIPNLKSNDIFQLSVEGSATELAKLDKKLIGMTHLGHSNFKLDKIVTSINIPEAPAQVTSAELMDSLVDSTTESEAQKKLIKELWREIL